ncbi:auxilin-related protein 2-like isoform X2 [Durio zibethinus]|uniref:Auxilin-related protein 2-like isoform X2 n=1 Tax=Durio zibethinus TaxID=66656 RepID=A0A6P6A1G7_DURZI|nr:auxilin-related protein 2-like isoform X2 [Durio zibethinus]
MDDFPGLLAKDFGIKPQGKSAPMAPPRYPSSSANFSSGPNYGFRSDFTRSSSGDAKSSSNSIFDDQDRDGLLSNDVYGGPPKYSSESRATTAQTSSFDYDSLFKDPKPPVFDKPVYDDDIFDGLPGIKTSSETSAAKYDNVFPISGSKQKSVKSSPFDDLLGSLGRKETEPKAKSERVKPEKDAPLFDDLLSGFGRSSSPASARSTSEAGQSQKPASNSSKAGSNLMENPFVVLESTSDPADSSSGLFTDPSEVISKLNGSGKSKVESSSGSGGVFDDIDPFGGLGKSVPPVSSEFNKRGKDRSPLRTASGSQTPTGKEPNDEDHDYHTKKRMPSMDNFPVSHQPVFDMPSMSTDFHSSVGRATSPPPYSNVGSNETNSQVNTTPRSEENFDTPEDVWLTVSEIPLFTQPTSAPPPSRPPPPRPPRVSRSMTGSFSSTNAKKVNDFSSFPNSPHNSHSSQSARAAASNSVTSPFDEFEDFAMGRAWNNVEQAELFPGDDFETNSVAAASAAAMKEAMDRAEAKFRHAKEMRERGNLKAARNKEAGQMDKDERAMQDALDREVREKHERLERERQREEEEREQRRHELEREREEKEREQRRLEKEKERVREMERERERARQAVERATREARERAATEARARAERAAVEKAAAEARERAERAAVLRAQAEARQRAAAEARERMEKVAAEAREREAREREARERTATAKVEAEERLRAERAAVERAAAEARERAASSARASQQKNDNDLESFFNMGSRPSSAPRPRANSSDPLFDGQNKGGPEVARGTSVGSSSSMRKASSTANIVDDLSSIFGAAASSSGEFQEADGETEERRRARLERHQRTQERAAKALAEKNQRDLQVQREQAERHVLWPECGWQPVSLTDLIIAAAVKKAYRKATLCIHPDKVQQKGANLQQKYIAEKVFDLLKEAWNKFNSEELF